MGPQAVQVLQSDHHGLLRGIVHRLRHLLPAHELISSAGRTDMRELFINELKNVQGGGKKPWPPCTCCIPTTLACGEEANGCSGCN